MPQTTGPLAPNSQGPGLCRLHVVTTTSGMFERCRHLDPSQTCILLDTSQILNHLSHKENSNKHSSVVMRELSYRKSPVEDLFPKYVVMMLSDKQKYVDSPFLSSSERVSQDRGACLKGASGVRSRLNPRLGLCPCPCDTYSQGGSVEKNWPNGK